MGAGGGRLDCLYPKKYSEQVWQRVGGFLGRSPAGGVVLALRPQRASSQLLAQWASVNQGLDPKLVEGWMGCPEAK